MLEIPIKIGRKEYFIQADTANYMLGYYVKSKRDENQFKGVHFFPTLQGLFTFILTLKIRKSTARTLEELRDVIIKAEKELVDVWKRAPIEEFEKQFKGDQ